MRPDPRCFGRLGQEDQRLKKHYSRWMDIVILRVIRRHFLACEDIAGGSDLSAGGRFFSRNTEALPVGPSRQVEESLFCA